MLKIGEFAKICNVSTQTLRYYDQEGILSPDKVDKYSGYRYYSFDKIDTLNRILKLKSLGFELCEIKEILSSDSEKQRAMYKNKITELKKEMNAGRDKLVELDRMCRDEDDATKDRKLSLRERLRELRFEDDPCVIGKWEICGRLIVDLEGEPRSLSDDIMVKSDSFRYKTLYFLPGGAFYWKFGWSRGVLYRLMPDKYLFIPNEYSIFELDGQKYMMLSWIDDECISGEEESYKLIYRKCDSHSYTESETRIRRDDLNIPFSPDERLVGEWRACALVESIDDFSPEKEYDKRELYTLGMTVLPRGMCYKVMRTVKGERDDPYTYSNGVIINTTEELVEHYYYKDLTVNGVTQTYLFVEHKSGDYKFEGKIYVYYVFRRLRT